MRAFAGLLGALGKIDGPKTVVWISGGLRAGLPGHRARDARLGCGRREHHRLRRPPRQPDGRHGCLGDAPLAVRDGGPRDAAARPRDASPGSPAARSSRRSGDGSNAFDRISREMRAYYLLGAEALPSDRDGHRHKIKVTVLKPGAFVRARREFTVATSTAGGRSGTPEEQVRGVLQAPLIATELPLKVATYSLRAPAGDKVRVVVASDIGRKETATLQATVGYVVSSAQGKVAGECVHADHGRPARSGHPGRRAFDRGDRPRARQVPAEAGRRRRDRPSRQRRAHVRGGHRGRGGIPGCRPDAHAAADDVGLDRASDGVSARRGRRPSTRTSSCTARHRRPRPRCAVEVADSESGPALSSLDVPIGESREKGRFSAEGPLPLGLLPPGKYHARAIVTSGSSSVTRVRQFTMNRAVPADDVFKNELHDRVGVFDPASGPDARAARTGGGTGPRARRRARRPSRPGRSERRSRPAVSTRSRTPAVLAASRRCCRRSCVGCRSINPVRSKTPPISSARRCVRLQTFFPASSIWARATPRAARSASPSARGRPRSPATSLVPRSIR